MDITINKSDVINYGNQIVSYSEELSDEIKKFNMLIESINSIWDGADALKYINVMKDKYVVGLDKLQEILLEYGNFLKKVADVYASLDETFANKNIDV